MIQLRCAALVGAVVGILAGISGCNEGQGSGAHNVGSDAGGAGPGGGRGPAAGGSGGTSDDAATPDLLSGKGGSAGTGGPDAGPADQAAPAMPGSDAVAPAPDAVAPADTAPAADEAPPATDTAAGAVDTAAGGKADAAPAKDGPPRTYPSSSPMSVALYDESTIVDYYLTFPPTAWNLLLTLNGPNETRWVQCTFTTLGGPVVNAACRRKGDMTDWAFERKPQIVVRFNLLDKQGRYRGLRRFNLESFDGAAAPIRDRIGMWVMREAGLDAPRVNHVRVFKDGALLGVYMNIEAEDKEFLEDHFGPTADNGNLWESGEELKTNETVNDRTRLLALNDLVENEPLVGDHAAFYAQLAARMDVAQVLREMAAETVILTNDNFSQGSTNFAYYEHPTRGFMVLPWDLDSIITVAPPSTELYGFKGVSEGSKLRELINQNPTWKAQFTNHLVDIRDNIMPRAAAKVDAVCAQIRAVVATDPNRTSSIEDFDVDCANVKNAIIQRMAEMKTLLGR